MYIYTFVTVEKHEVLWHQCYILKKYKLSFMYKNYHLNESCNTWKAVFALSYYRTATEVVKDRKK